MVLNQLRTDLWETREAPLWICCWISENKPVFSRKWSNTTRVSLTDVFLASLFSNLMWSKTKKLSGIIIHVFESMRKKIFMSLMKMNVVLTPSLLWSMAAVPSWWGGASHWYRWSLQETPLKLESGFKIQHQVNLKSPADTWFSNIPQVAQS